MSSSWRELSLASPISSAALAETLDGGQCFRWNRGEDDIWRGVSGRTAAELRPGRDDRTLEFRLLAGASDELAHHLAADVDWSAQIDRLPWRSDPHLARCLAAFPGLRILRQPLGEALLCFLCSATKQIVQIKQMTALLAQRFGEEIAPRIHALPTWPQLARVSETDLRACLLGFRAKYIAAVAAEIARAPALLDEIAALPYPAAKETLMRLPGVGEKVADCVLLFGGGQLAAFPVDVWILRAMAERYGLAGWRPAQVAHFGRVHFGALAGLAQQYLFAFERRRMDGATS